MDEDSGNLHDLDASEIVNNKGAMPDDGALFAGASELSDQGFGDFDVCLTVLTAKRGDLKKAKNALSKVIFSKQKHLKSNKKWFAENWIGKGQLISCKSSWDEIY